jgi:hypothetical protein
MTETPPVHADNELGRRIHLMEHGSGDCLGSGAPMIRSSLLWLAAGAAAWVIMATLAAR